MEKVTFANKSITPDGREERISSTFLQSLSLSISEFFEITKNKSKNFRCDMGVGLGHWDELNALYQSQTNEHQVSNRELAV